MNKNHRQAYAVHRFAGEQTSAASWGTGRAVSRIPRVPGGGTHRAGQAAFGNMCRGGRMFAPTKVWRRWHIRISKGQRRFATCSALAASAVAPLVMARGHQISTIAEVPLVVADDEINGIEKTKDAVKLLNALGAGSDLERVASSYGIRRGSGKARNRRYVKRRGPLIVHDKNRENSMLIQSFRNIRGVDLVHVEKLNLLSLAPGGHVGRFIIWTQSAFAALDSVFGSRTADATKKGGFRPPRSILTTTDIGRVINSDEVQSALRPINKQTTYEPRRRNPLKNLGAMVKVNPFILTKKRRAIQAHEAGLKKRQGKQAYNRSVFMSVLNTPSIAPPRGIDEIPVANI